MQQRRSFLPSFFLFFFLSGLIFFLSSRNFLPGENFFQNIFFSFQGGVFQVVHIPFGFFHNNALQKLQKENLALQAQLVHEKQLEEDNAALRDQFQTASIPSTSLLPATVIGAPQFIPGVGSPENLVIDKGTKSGVVGGETVIYQRNVVGTISGATDWAAQVMLVSSANSSFTAKTVGSHAQGVLSGEGEGSMVLGSVLLSDTLQVGDIVVTSGSEDGVGKGFPPGLIVGKIISVNKTPSSLYQSARVQSLLQFNKLTTVFVIKGKE